MNQQHSVVVDPCTTSMQGPQVNLLNDLKRYRQLDSAVRQGQKDIIELLLDEGTPVNRHHLFGKVRTLLHSAVQFGDAEVVEKLLSKGASVNAKYWGDTPLTLAAKFGKCDITDLLLQAHGLENVCNDGGITHFHVSCMRGQVDVARKLLQSLQDVNAIVDGEFDYWPGFTPLHFAVQFQHIEVVKFLLSVGADITVQNAMQLTPLHLAHLLRNEEIIDMILATHVNLVNNPVNSQGLSHFHIACTRNNPKIVEYFVKLGVNLEDIVSEETSHWQYRTALDLAIHYECTDVVRLLLCCGALVQRADGERYERIRDAFWTGNEEIISLLIASDRLDKKMTSIEELPNFLGSFSSDDVEIMRSLITERGNAINSPVCCNGSTLLHLAIENGNQEVSEFLLNRGADYTFQNIQGKSPLHLAFERNMNDLVDLMLENHKELDANPISNDGLSHLHIACAKGAVSTITYLLKFGADVNRPVKFDSLFWPGFTPLHFASEFGREKAALALLEHGANYSATNASDLSAFDIALIRANRLYSEEHRVYKNLFGVMKLILSFNLRHKDPLFNDRGTSLLHIAVAPLSDLDTKEMSTLLKAHSNEINKNIHKMNTSWDGYTPLHFVAQLPGNRDFAKLLVNMGADVLRQASNGDTPLHLLKASTILPEIIINHNDTRFLEMNFIGSKGLSIFHNACVVGDLRLMKYFLDHGVDANCPSVDLELGCYDSAPLHLVIMSEPNSSVDAVKLLLNHGADPNVRDSQRNTPLHFMTNNCHFEIIEILVSHGADINARNVLFETPLMSLCLESYVGPEYLKRHVESFLNNGANINLADERGGIVLTSLMHFDPNQHEDYLHVINTLLIHVVKLRIMGFYESDLVKNAYLSLIRRFSDFLEFNQDTLTEKCLKELELMEKIYLNNYTTLKDILFEDPNRLAVMSRNESFRNLISSEDFLSKCPIYHSDLQLRLRQGQVRWPLLQECLKNFNFLCGVSLPQVCADKIAQHLGNEDLKNLISIRK